ncbi:MAG: hypothetical protein QNI97_05065, partial [Desulfobacterales bacterium]|nr:hypothetical protein [Desulfobacterales bacterium]
PAPEEGRGSVRLTYHIREIENRQKTTGENPARWQESYTETTLMPSAVRVEGGFPPVRRLLEISDVADRFANRLKAP